VQLDELARDGEAEARAVMLPRRARVHLRELAEDEVMMLGRDADARVAHLDDALGRAVALAAVGADPHLSALRREVDRVADEIPDDVRDLLAIGVHGLEVVGHVCHETQSLLAHERLVDRAQLREHVAQVEPSRRDGELIRRAARVGEDLADLVEELASAVDDARDAVELAVAERTEDAVSQDLRVGDHRGERGAEIVGDVREELGLQRVAGLEVSDVLKSLLQLRLQRDHATFGAAGLRE
jgi:hypothetical protein